MNKNKQFVTAGVILYNSKNEVLTVRGKKHAKWSFPKGHIEKGETIPDCAKREFQEETGRKLSGTEKLIGTFEAMDGYYYILEIEGEDLEVVSEIDTNEVHQVAWCPERTLHEKENNNAGIKQYCQQVIRPKYYKPKEKKKVVIDEDGWELNC